ncbi:MAG: single-stranded DNA-binding protein [Holdemanella sp.]|nr:single-stranded DNA-binding protein [Holdemanella sp.]
MNLFVLVGNVVELPELKETNNGFKTCTVTLSVERSYANSDGLYEYDEIQVEVWRGLAETLCSTTKKGDFISVKGRIATRLVNKDGHTYFNYSFVAEKITFIGK